jgi:hypothetical protein
MSQIVHRSPNKERATAQALASTAGRRVATSPDPLIADIPTIVLSGPAGWSNAPVAKPVDVKRLLALGDQYC